MRRLWRGIVRTMFWSYERGTWQYDAMVIAIVLFVLVTPRRWFHDQPQIGPMRGGSVELVSQDDTTRVQTYRVDAHLIAKPKGTPELERALHEAISRSVEVLKDRKFEVVRVDPAFGPDGEVLYYDVQIKP